MALNIFEELDLTATGDNVDEGFLKCKNNWSDMDTELNAARNGETSLLVAMRDLDGDELILDADGDTSITADTDDQIDIRCSGQDQITITDGSIAIPDSTIVWNTVTKTIAISSPSAAANVDTTGLTAGGLYTFRYRLAISTPAVLIVSCNGDAGSTYCETWHAVGEIAGAAVDEVANAGGRAGNFRMYTQTATYFEGFFTFSSAPGDNTIALFNYQNAGYTDASNFYHASGSGFYDGAASVTQVTLAPGEGTITGTVIVERTG